VILQNGLESVKMLVSLLYILRSFVVLEKSVLKPVLKENNHCPFTLDPPLSKMSENVVSNQLITFLHKHNILGNSQF
jgi:hypothetical protein